jgi:hypothetical protein
VKPCKAGTLLYWADETTCCGVAPVQPSSTVGNYSSGCYIGGDLYATSDCSGHFYCINGKPGAVRYCNSGSTFDTKIKNCYWPLLSTCCFVCANAQTQIGKFEMLPFVSEFSEQSLPESVAFLQQQQQQSCQFFYLNRS